ncbi:hypothetical protein [Inquilinus sp.]|jgi:hypothetical protein|uniref:hypothetical protein n=1 Tax=Inquilinus sp. TaxID=1932117 RepID=UPI003783C567
MAYKTIDEIWADFTGTGAIKEPHKLEIRQNLNALWAVASAAGMNVYLDKATMDADTSQADGQPALLYADPVDENNYPTVWIWDDGGAEWIAGVDRISDLEDVKDLRLPVGLQNRFPDPEGLGLGSQNKDGVRTHETIDGDAQPIISFTTSGTNNIYDFKVEGEFAVGAVPTFSGLRKSDVVGAAGTFNAPVSIRYLDVNGVQTTIVENKSTTGTAWEAFSITGVAIPAGSGIVRVQFGHGTTGTFARFPPRSLLLVSNLSPAGIFKPRDLSAKLIGGLAGLRRCAYSNGAWRDGGVVASSADGPCVLAGTKSVWSMRDALSVSDKVAELYNQTRTARLIPAGGTAGIRDKRGLGAGSAAARLASASTGIQAAQLLGVTVLPNSAADVPPNGGFAGTGYAEIPSTAATWAGCIVAANHGRANEADPTSNASIIILAPVDGRVKLAEYNQSATTGTGSIQGVAVRTVGGVSMIWYNDKSAKLLRELSLTGTLSGTTIDLSSITPNGVAYDAAQDAFWVSNEGVAEARLFSATTGSELATTIIPSTTDHLSWVNGYLSVSYGNNGSPGTVDLRDPETSSLVTRHSGLPYAEAIEGHFWRQTANGMVLTYGVDGNFHIVSKPALGMLVRVAVPTPPDRNNTNELLACMVVRVTGTPSQSCYVIGDGSPLDTTYYGWACSIVSATTVRFQVRTNGDGAAISVDFVIPGLAYYPKRITFLYSKAAGTVRCWYAPIGGANTEVTAVGSASIAGITQKLSTTRHPTMFGLPGSPSRFLEATDVAAAGVWDATTAVQASVEAYIDQLCAGLTL